MKSELSLSKPPVVDAIVELRFESELPSQVIAGVLFSKLGEHGYGSFEELDIAQFPQSIKDEDINLRYMPHYRFRSAGYFVSISSRVISIVAKCVGESKYQGWNSYKLEVEKILGEFKSLSATSNFSRIAVRYVNLFENSDIFSKINIGINAPNSEHITDEQVIGFVYSKDNVSTRINFAGKANVSFVEGDNASGAVLDIDSSIEREAITFDEALSLIETGHSATEDAFVSILKEDFIEELK